MARKRDDWLAPGRQGAVPVRLLPLALSAIWAITALPVDVSPFGMEDRLWRAGLSDFVGNIVLYIPLGIALRRFAWWRVVLVAAGLSVAAECSQLWYPDRFASLTDVAANLGGAFFGYAIAVGLFRVGAGLPDPLELTGRIAAAAALLFVAGAFVLTRPGVPADFSNWDPECRVIAGDELTRDRPWKGEIHTAAVFNRSLGGEQIARLSRPGREEDPHEEIARLSPLFLFRPSSPLDSIRGAPLMGEAEQERFLRALVESGELCLVVRFRTRSENQRGPARIIGFSKSPWAHNFLLGQEGRAVVFRLRTPTTLPGGFFPPTVVRDVLDAGRDVVVAADYDGRNVRVHVDGRRRARLNLSARGKPSPFLSDAGLPSAAFLLGALIGVGWVAAARKRNCWSLMRWGAAGGALGGAAFIAAGGADALPEFAAWVPVISAWGGAVIGASAVPGRMCGPTLRSV